MLFALLIFLIVLSAFFSASETGMMAINRYRLRHLARKSHTRAMRVAALLENPDRLLSVILIGNTITNIAASAVGTVIAVHYYGEVGAAISAVLLTLIILIFAETAPKTYAALHPQRTAFLSSGLLALLLTIFRPLVWIVNHLSNALLIMFGVRIKKRMAEPLSIEELRSVVHESIGPHALSYQNLLLRVLDLQKLTVSEIMVPKNEIDGIDLTWEWPKIAEHIVKNTHDYLPLYRHNINQVQGILMLRRALVMLHRADFDKEQLLRLADEAYFIPDSVLLYQQLLNFQREKKMMGLVVDEYGDVQGVLTMQDVLEEIVGEFATSAAEVARWITPQQDGSVLVDARITVRDLNRLTHWNLPVDGPRTLSGLIIEYLEMMPTMNVSVRIGGYPMEILSVAHNTILQVRVWPPSNTKI